MKASGFRVLFPFRAPYWKAMVVSRPKYYLYVMRTSVCKYCKESAFI